jgi:hypothetical protein
LPDKESSAQMITACNTFDLIIFFRISDRKLRVADTLPRSEEGCPTDKKTVGKENGKKCIARGLCFWT